MISPAENLAIRIIGRLQAAGHVAYLAGGCVRDRVMGRVPKDFDVATSARPEEVLRLFPRGQQVGAAFGVILVVERAGDSRIQVEVATFRADGTYSDGRHPDSVQFTTAQEDARRRDFTCNGLFLDPLAKGAGGGGQGLLHDFVGGRDDIEKKILRAIGDPAARFREDHLRMLRAVRFAARLGFTIEPGTREAIVRHAPQIKAISRERIGEELRLILEHASRAAAVELLASMGLLANIWPLPVSGSASFMPPLMAGLAEPTSRALALAAWARDQGTALPHGEVADSLQQAFALSNEERDEIGWLLEKRPVLLDRARWTRPTIKKLLADPRWPDLHALYLAQIRGTVAEELAAWIGTLRAEGIAPVPFVNGEALISLGAVPGPSFKKWLEELYDRQLEGELTTVEQAMEAARRLIH